MKSPAASVHRWVRRVAQKFATKPVEGFVDGAVGSEIMGWAMDPNREGRRVHVVAVAKGRIVAEALANLPRNDLLSAGKGDGRHGFRLHVLPGIDQIGPMDVSVQAVATTGNITLKRGNILISADQTGLAPVQQAPKSEVKAPAVVVGYVESCESGLVCGWACDPNDASDRPQIDIFDGEKYLGTTEAIERRADLSPPKAPDGARGFSFVLPVDASADIHTTVRVRLARQRLDLKRAGSYSRPNRPALIEPVADQSDSEIYRKGFIHVGPGLGTDDLFFDPHGHEAIKTLAALLTMREWLILTPFEGIFNDGARKALVEMGAVDIVASFHDGDESTLWPDLLVRLGRSPQILAVRTEHIPEPTPALINILNKYDTFALACLIIELPLRWSVLADGHKSKSSTPSTMENHAPQDPVLDPGSRVSVALASGWGKATSPRVLSALLTQLYGTHVDILVPTVFTALEDLGKLPGTEGLASLNIRWIDSPRTSGPEALLLSMMMAASGQTVVASSISLELGDLGDVRRLIAWTKLHTVAVTCQSQKTQIQACLDVPLVALSRAAFARIERPDMKVGADWQADIGAQFADAGLACIILSDQTSGLTGADAAAA